MDVPAEFQLYADVLALLDNVRFYSSGHAGARCPVHGDSRNSLSITIGRNGSLLMNCCAPAACSAKEICKQIGVSMGMLFPDRHQRDMGSAPRRRVQCVYPYHDEQGNFLYECVRWEPKDFSYRRPNPDFPDASNDKYIWNIAGVRRVLYQLPALVDLRANNPTREVLLLEGEKDVDRARSLGFVATTAPMGAKNWLADYSEMLRGLRVNIVYDLDKWDHKSKERAGYAHALTVGRALYGVAASVRLVRLPFPTSEERKYDFSDWVDSLQGARPQAALWELVKQTSLYYPGWEFASDFQRLQTGALLTMQMQPQPLDINALGDVVRRELDAFFNGLHLTRMMPDAARLCGALQFLCEHVQQAHGIRADIYERPRSLESAADAEERLLREWGT